ncbi:MAG: FtsW/RodA/SpoVE family cell cycle protein [Clostridia bacterium]|nr:FtsW/RodA/SpoVE family cell cycle protein [Clostridia bacterium]MDD6040282.1 FtsW/RodA/SpoVE family cell cycle protein [Clostridia bacterium]
MMVNESRRSRAHFDWQLMVLAFGLAAFGVLAVSVATFSTSSEVEDTLLNYIVSSYYGMRQAIFFFVAFVVVLFIAYFPYEILRRRAAFFYLLACGLLAITLITNRAQGVKAWTDLIWGYTIQPSEFVKLACIIVVAKYLETDTQPLSTSQSWIRLGLLVAVPWMLTLAQGEMGSVLVMIFIFGVMMYFGGARIRVLMGVAAAGGIALAILYGYMVASGSDSYRLERILSFIDPTLADESASYQQTNSKIAIGSGGLYGRGTFVQGAFSQLDYVPEDWTDFIFSTIGEAFGFIGSFLVILTYLLIILRMLYLARYTVDRFGRLTIIGVMAMLLFHVFENVGMATGLMPITGIPLPFLSYGGSNLVTNMAGIGLVMNVVKNRNLTTIHGLNANSPYAPQTGVMRKWAR